VFRKVLVANRGEIACRVASTLREMGIVPVAVYSEADRGSLHTREMDEAVEIGPAEPRASYLDIGAIVEAARRTACEAVHPGYGFLSENAAFAEAVEAAGLTFIGPTPMQIRAMGDKRAARELAVAAGVPVVPGGEGADAAALAAEARRIGYPVLVKAALGGGGKGMRVVEDEGQLHEALESARRVAASAFGDAAVYLEKRVLRARHIEVQVLGDGRGDAIHLLERECSLQRRHQKVLEECPSPVVEEWLRERITAAAVNLAKAVRYRGAGTVEFLLGRDGQFHFLEMNTRLQVEHPVTEWVTGIDLVRAQVVIAAGGRLPFEQRDVVRRGHAVEARIYAEDPARGFLPQAGEAVRVRWPRQPFVRVDAGVESSDPVPVHYDPILGKIIAYGTDRGQALDRLAHSLDETRLHGIATNLPFLRALARAPEVREARFDTEWIEREFLTGFTVMATAPVPGLVLAAAAIADSLGVWPGPTTGAAVGVPARGQGLADAYRAAGRWRQPGLE
jgi:acetyl/propionyl-CoA carboxylase alpha subunit